MIRNGRRLVGWGITAVLLLFLLAGCGGGATLTYRVDGTATEAKVAYFDSRGNMALETVALPWEARLSIQDGDRFEISVDNVSGAGSVSCTVWIEDREIGSVEGKTFAECSGLYVEDETGFSTNFRGRYDSAPGGE